MLYSLRKAAGGRPSKKTNFLMGLTLMGPRDSEGEGAATKTESSRIPLMMACRWASQEEATRSTAGLGGRTLGRA